MIDQVWPGLGCHHGGTQGGGSFSTMQLGKYEANTHAHGCSVENVFQVAATAADLEPRWLTEEDGYKTSSQGRENWKHLRKGVKECRTTRGVLPSSLAL